MSSLGAKKAQVTKTVNGLVGTGANYDCRITTLCDEIAGKGGDGLPISLGEHDLSYSPATIPMFCKLMALLDEGLVELQKQERRVERAVAALEKEVVDSDASANDPPINTEESLVAANNARQHAFLLGEQWKDYRMLLTEAFNSGSRPPSRGEQEVVPPATSTLRRDRAGEQSRSTISPRLCSTQEELVQPPDAPGLLRGEGFPRNQTTEPSKDNVHPPHGADHATVPQEQSLIALFQSLRNDILHSVQTQFDTVNAKLDRHDRDLARISHVNAQANESFIYSDLNNPTQEIPRPEGTNGQQTNFTMPMRHSPVVEQGEHRYLFQQQPHTIPHWNAVPSWAPSEHHEQQWRVGSQMIPDRNMPNANTIPFPVPGTTQPISTTPVYRSATLPPLKVHTFDGKKSGYAEFKTVFAITIGSHPIHPVEKFLYLKELLPKEDKLAISHYPLTQAGYELTWQHLDRKYGGISLLARELRDKMTNLRSPDSTIQSNLNMWLEAQAIAAQMESEKLLEPMSVIDTIMSKFSPDIQSSIAAQFSDSTDRNWKEFSNLTTETLRKLEVHAERFSRYNAMRANPYADDKNQMAKVANRSLSKCIYCESYYHYSSECTIVPLAKKIHFLRSHSRCERCTRGGHKADECYSSLAMCQRCQDRHHRSLPCRPSPQGQYRGTGPNNQGMQGTISHGPPATTMLNIIQRTLDTVKKHVPDSGSALHHNLPILFGKVVGKSESVPILLDCGAQVSLINSSLAHELNLTSERSTTLNLTGFQSSGCSTTVSHIVHLTLEGPTEFKLPVHMYTIDIPVGDIECTNLSSVDKKFLKKRKILLPQHGMEPTIQPAIILGVDVLWEIFHGMETTKLPSGNTLIVTKLGSLITGPSSHNSIMESNGRKVNLARQCHMIFKKDRIDNHTVSSDTLPMAQSDHHTLLNVSANGKCREVQLIKGKNRSIQRPLNKVIPRELDACPSLPDGMQSDPEVPKVAPNRPRYMTRRTKRAQHGLMNLKMIPTWNIQQPESISSSAKDNSEKSVQSTLEYAPCFTRYSGYPPATPVKAQSDTEKLTPMTNTNRHCEVREIHHKPGLKDKRGQSQDNQMNEFQPLNTRDNAAIQRHADQTRKRRARPTEEASVPLLGPLRGGRDEAR